VKDAKKVLNDLILMANIAYVGDAGAAGWARMAEEFEEAGADIIELNMCCPNMSYNLELTSGGASSSRNMQEAVVSSSRNNSEADASSDYNIHSGAAPVAGKRSGASLGRQGAEIAEIVNVIKKSVAIPVFVKLTPEGGDIAQTASLLFAAGADAVGGTSNRMGMPRINLDDPASSPFQLQDEISMSCFCGHWLKPLTLRDAFEIRKANGMEPAVMMAGGVSDWKDAAELILCGADLVGVCTEILLNGYDIVKPMIRGVAEYMDKRGYSGISAMKGAIIPLVRTAGEITLHDGYAKIINPGLSAPCKAACPRHIPVQAVIRMTAAKNYKRAFELIDGAGAARGGCPEDCGSPCEKACLRGRSGRPLAVRKLIRFVLDYNEPSAGVPGARAVGAAFADDDAAVAEAARCLSCGCGEGCRLCETICCFFAPKIVADDTLEIDRDECVACGMCRSRCPSGNIEMIRI
jgi:dihydroorotate dehydrogenase